MGAAFHNLQGDNRLLFFLFFSFGPASSSFLHLPFFFERFVCCCFFLKFFLKGTQQGDPLTEPFFLLCWLIFVCFNILCGYFSCIFPSLLMILILLAWILLFILLLIILFFGWLLWGLWFNFTSVQFDCFFIYFLIIFSIDFCFLLNTSGFWASCLSLFLSVLFFYNYTKDEDVCYVIGAFKVKRRPSCLYDFFSMFCIEIFFMRFIFSPLIDLSTLAHLFWFDPHASFWKTCEFSVFGLPTSSLNVSTCFSLISCGVKPHTAIQNIFNCKKM